MSDLDTVESPKIAVGPAPAVALPILAVVGFGVFVAADDLTVVSTMLRPIIGDLGSSCRMGSMTPHGSSTPT